MRTHLLLPLLLGCIAPYKILVYIPKFAISHINFVGKVADTLEEAGNNVTALISDIDPSLPDGAGKAHILRIPSAEGSNHMNANFMVGETDMFEIDSDSYASSIQNARHNAVSFCRQCRKLLTTPGLVERLKEEKYDALITENLDNCGVGLSHIITARSLIIVSSTYMITPTDVGMYLSLVSDTVASPDGHYHQTIYSRIMYLYKRFTWYSFMATQNEPLQRVFDELYPGTPSFSHLVSHSAVIFPNYEPLISTAFSTISKIVPIGGITVGKPKPLDDYWHTILSLRPKTVLVSFGSIAKSVLMKPARKEALLEAFSSFPDTTFIWKYENISDLFSTRQAAKVPNVVLVEWMPQLDLLADRRLSLFITHGGMASCQELASFGVPSLIVPIFGDQIHNAAGLAHNGIADVFNKFDMTDSGKIKSAIGKMLSNPSYKASADRIREQLAARPTTPAQQLVSHVEFAARFGESKSLRPLNLELSFVQFWGIDLVLTGLIAVVIGVAVLICLYSTIRWLLSFIGIRKVHRKVD